VGYLVLFLAGIGAFVVARIVLKSAGSTARVFKAVEAFQATSLEAYRAIHGTADEDRQFRAVLAWERGREAIALMPVNEQALVLSTLKDRGCQVSEIVATVEAFKQSVDRDNAQLDADLAELVQNS
jgi:hypothetical protein